MKWVEEIKLRAAVQKETEALHRLTGLASDIQTTPGLSEVRALVHATISGDYSLHLIWDTPNAQIQGSPLGFHLKERLRPLGLLEHTIWIEQANGFKEEKP